ncbi:hypothetical protein SISNIDRAFT_55432 [Sistotremastrum niveocremeum HHB9708]|uniref:Uncharacterized protein n=1 Tax=Sistotremastrum niveocremeum HHB9708 TaxID=1314777 RepID=A0A164VCC8_9AGAM|nr:hypothetical protein SISNIDRAFT_55432 [Sistotremastrum niveocremeum HHB9708]
MQLEGGDRGRALDQTILDALHESIHQIRRAGDFYVANENRSRGVRSKQLPQGSRLPPNNAPIDRTPWPTSDIGVIPVGRYDLDPSWSLLSVKAPTLSRSSHTMIACPEFHLLAFPLTVHLVRLVAPLAGFSTVSSRESWEFESDEHMFKIHVARYPGRHPMTIVAKDPSGHIKVMRFIDGSSPAGSWLRLGLPADWTGPGAPAYDVALFDASLGKLFLVSGSYLRILEY